MQTAIVRPSAWVFVPASTATAVLRARQKEGPLVSVPTQLLRDIMAQEGSHAVLSLEDNIAVLRLVQGFLFGFRRDSVAKLPSLPLPQPLVKLEWVGGKEQDVWPLSPSRDGKEVAGTTRVSCIMVMKLGREEAVAGMILQLPLHVAKVPSNDHAAMQSIIAKLADFDEDDSSCV